MKQLGFTGLALEENPFVMRAPEPVRPVVVPKPAAAAPPPKKPKQSGPNLFEIMESVSSVMEEENTAAKAAAIDGADKVEKLRNLYRAFYACQACALGTTRHRFVFGEGSPEAKLFFIGEGPGEEEDNSGRPFMGADGQLLTKIIRAMDLNRNDVFITNIVKCRPPGNRTPLADETAACTPILTKQIEILQPKVIVTLGASAFSYFRGENASLMRSRGQFFEWKGIQVMPTFHPAYVLRNPRAKRDVWADMQQVMALLNG